jgi:hypothetical protein
LLVQSKYAIHPGRASKRRRSIYHDALPYEVVHQYLFNFVVAEDRNGNKIFAAQQASQVSRLKTAPEPRNCVQYSTTGMYVVRCLLCTYSTVRSRCSTSMKEAKHCNDENAATQRQCILYFSTEHTGIPSILIYPRHWYYYERHCY